MKIECKTSESKKKKSKRLQTKKMLHPVRRQRDGGQKPNLNTILMIQR